jgi:RNA polymerase sigma factor (sigma-70 family)
MSASKSTDARNRAKCSHLTGSADGRAASEAFVRLLSRGTQVERPAQDMDVRNLIAWLPPKLRNPFLLHYYGDFGIREVAALLGKPEGTIKADLFAARAKLKTGLGERAG